MMVGCALNKKQRIKSYTLAFFYCVVIIFNIVKPTAISLSIAIVLFWICFFKDSFFVDFRDKSNAEIEKSIHKKGVDWIVSYLLAGVPAYIFYFNTIPTKGITNQIKFILAIVIFLLVILTLFVICIQKYKFIKKKMYKACLITGGIFLVYFGLIFCEMNYFLDYKKDTLEVNVEETTSYRFHTNFFYYNDEGKKKCVTTYKILREDFDEILLHTDEGAFGIVYRNVFDKGSE